MNRYRKFQTLVMGMSVLDVPIGIFTGYMMAEWNWLFLVGAVILVITDLANSKAWLKEIEVAIREVTKLVLSEKASPAGEPS